MPAALESLGVGVGLAVGAGLVVLEAGLCAGELLAEAAGVGVDDGGLAIVVAAADDAAG